MHNFHMIITERRFLVPASV